MASKTSAAAALSLTVSVFFTLSNSWTPPSPSTKYPIDTIKLGVCANVLSHSGLIDATIGTPPKEPCCSLIKGLVDLEAAVCVCTAIKANILNIHLNISINLSLFVNYCGKKVPSGFKYA